MEPRALGNMPYLQLIFDADPAGTVTVFVEVVDMTAGGSFVWDPSDLMDVVEITSQDLVSTTQRSDVRLPHPSRHRSSTHPR